ncbi:MAG: MarR family transcriptional regulator [Microbacteriaceae bacterium]|nr:MarR family transcriptional regulator [Microbacteriaceae bacterium]
MSTEYPEPIRYTGHLIRRAEQRHVAAWQTHSPDATNVQFAALAVIARRPGASQRELGDELDLDRSTIADLVRRLEHNGLITRTASTVDRRRFELEVTDAGRAEIERLRPIALRIEQELFGDMTPDELAAFRRFLQTMLRPRA